MNASREVVFDVEVLPEHARAFAEVSGDWNPLHTDAAYAATSQYGRPILHGAFAAGLLSRVAGMHIPGTDCLLYSMQLRFLQPILPPATLRVHGRLVSERGETGRVEVTISDAQTSVSLVSGSYEFGRHAAEHATASAPRSAALPSGADGEAVILVTGSRGAIGATVLSRLGTTAVGVSTSQLSSLSLDDFLAQNGVGDRPISAIVHCGWPSPDNTRLTKTERLTDAIGHHVSDPLIQTIMLARLLAARGTPDALLLLVGSTASAPGRHNFRSPLYALSKSMLPLLSRILAVELGPGGRRCATVVLDVVEAGMSKGMSGHARAAHEGRSPAGRIPAAGDVADQLVWMLANRSFLLSGATISLSGGALP